MGAEVEQPSAPHAQAGILPEAFRGAEISFVLLPPGEKFPPLEKAWQEKPHSLNEAVEWVERGGNAGVLIRYPFGGLDQDSPEAFRGLDLPATTAWETRPGRRAYLVRWEESEAEIAQILRELGKRENTAQLKLYQNGAHVGELKLQRTYQVIPPSWKSIEGVRTEYRMVQDVPPAKVSLRRLIQELQGLGITFSERPDARARTEANMRVLEALREERARRARDTIAKAEEFLQRAIQAAEEHYRTAKDKKEGIRNDTGFWLACQLRDLGLDAGTASEFMARYQRAVRGLGGHEYTQDEAMRSLHEAYSSTPREPPRRQRDEDEGEGERRARGAEGEGEESEIDLDSIAVPENPKLEVRLEPDNLISLYIEYGKSASDAYPEYHYASALVMLSTITKRNLVLRLAQDDVYPNIWVFLLGRSTISRKSAAVKKCERILNAVCPELALPQSYSPEGLIEELSERPHGYLIKDEAGAMLAAMQKNYMLEMRDLYCVLYDNQSYRRKLRSGQRKERREFNILNPYMSILTATTPQTFREHTQMIDLTSGWLLRFLYFYPNYRKDWMAFRPAGDEDFERYGAVIGRLMKLRRLFFDRVKPLEIKLSEEAWSYYQAWQRQREMELQEETDDILLAFWGRLSFYALKLAMLFTVGRADYTEATEVTLEHVREACRQVDEYFLPTARIVAEEVAREETKNLQNRIIGLLRSYGGKMKQRDLLMRLHVPLREYEEACEALIASEEIARVKDKRAIWVVLTQPERSVACVSSVSVLQVFHEFQSKPGINETGETLETLETLATLATHSSHADLDASDLNHPLACHRIKSALARGITDPLELSRACGLPVCIVARYADREPRIDAERAREVLAAIEAHRSRSSKRESGGAGGCPFVSIRVHNGHPPSRSSKRESGGAGGADTEDERAGESERGDTDESAAPTPSTEPPSDEALISELVRRGEIPNLSPKVADVLKKKGDHGAPAMEITGKLGIKDLLPGEVRRCLEAMARFGLVRNRGVDPKEKFDGEHWIWCGDGGEGA